VTVREADAWREQTSSTFVLRTYPGGHFYLDARVPDVVEVIAARLGTVTRA
jgi:surfactin synthase thioesterase subunit